MYRREAIYKEMCPPDYAIGALAQLFCDVVPLIDNEILVEHLEDLSALHVRHRVSLDCDSV